MKSPGNHLPYQSSPSEAGGKDGHGRFTEEGLGELTVTIDEGRVRLWRYGAKLQQVVVLASRCQWNKYEKTWRD